MSLIKQQLRKFYAVTQPGLTDKERRSAMRYDMRQVRKNHQCPTANCHATAAQRALPIPADYCLGSAFVWRRTPQGADYWGERDGFWPD